ncbi:Sulfotransferase family cytosolic 1B member 1 [Seminavis robusta]|uniref:Sulfotransferase family cytosolic 1B member 1 n=1 Tax=Seminavis robusta TaxID=568900 RepID=A0A9N8HCK9_9STRA|nr:Sulfotransferase family cytosolic 1B member 1 [Seminavis robusta]|eukprot:Sro323_g117210.1 Sulfotransferase family cytosolic 1B member 1 (311) ;mRNA; r:4674-5606
MDDDLPPLPTLPITSQETLRKCRELPVGDKDIFIASFPKSGTTWMQNIVFQLVSASVHQDDNLPLDHISQYAPFFEIDAHWESSSSDGPPQMISKIRDAHKALGYRIFNTHLRWGMLPKGPGTRYIYVVRDGRDTLTSFYHHMSNQHPDDGGFQGDFEAFFQQFLDGTIAYGKWSHHLASWMPHCSTAANANANPQILLVRYEDLKQDRKQEIVRIAKFLQVDIDANNQAFMDRVLERTSFEWMREHQGLFHPISVRWKPGYNFIRKGSVGDHDSLFDEEHRKQFLDTVTKDLGGANHVPTWLHEYCFHK